MAIHINITRTKDNNKLTNNPLNPNIRAMIFGPSSSSTSGSEHDAESEYDVVSPPPSLSLSHLINNFLEPTDSTTESTHPDSDSDEFRYPNSTALIETIINPSVHNNGDHFRNHLVDKLTKAVHIFSLFRKNKPVFNRNLMAYLREIGYNAGVCKTRWDSTGGGLAGGNYEFIDVVSPEFGRYLVDCDFSGEFEIARETESYRQLRSSLPKVLVAKCDDLKRIVRLMCDEGRRSIKINGLSLPPWRKNRYMQAKWLGPYRRSTNVFPVMTSPGGGNLGVKCRSVGFDVAGESGRVLVAPARMR